MMAEDTERISYDDRGHRENIERWLCHENIS